MQEVLDSSHRWHQSSKKPLSKQKTTLFSVHLVGAVLTFGVGALYILVQTLLSLHMQPHFHSKTVYLARLAIGVWTLCSIISSIL